ncbi:conjugative transposon protein TraJ [Filimonas effusa]|uniref:Conjugative transposon protein TraJ n=1 Tax=Filimonas effusa TaxID=2508721 RepID=A0A4V1MAT4_9BACT|nr:conjugative transposon protein TraJ [Filimonas effusa]RXK86986.1 conjugative transposon protein TraJ [Filimonas effusa]
MGKCVWSCFHKSRKGLLRASVLVVSFLVGHITAQAQDTGGGLAGDIKSLHSVLDTLYDEMMPLCSQLIAVGRGIAGFAALWFIAARVWGHLARAEAIDFYPLFRPFVIGMAVILFPTAVIGVINGVMKPTVSGTAALVQNSDQAITELLKQKEEAVKNSDYYEMYVGENGQGDIDKWYKYTHPDDTEGSAHDGLFSSIGNDIKFAMAKASYNFRNSIKAFMAEVLQVLFAAASLCINTMRTFNLIILAILGPLAFGISVFDGFHHTLKHWIARYLNVFLWLPVANIFGAVIGKIQENMLKLDISQVNQSGDTFFSRTDAGYLIFMIIGIVGYLTVPSIAGQIIHVGGGDALTGKTTALAGAAAGAAAGVAGAAVGAAVSGTNAIGNMAENGAQKLNNMIAGDNGKSIYDNAASGIGYGLGYGGAYMYDKLKGDQTDGKVS